VHRYFVTGTDTDVGKTRVTAALALALKRAGRPPTIVKLVQTGVQPDGEGDAQRAAALAGTPHAELARFAKPADPWSAALNEDKPPLYARQLAGELDKIAGALVAEGAGGILTPRNASEQLGHVAAEAKLKAVIAIGLRLGCLNHALLTVRACQSLGIPIAGAVLIERWAPTDVAYREDVERALHGKLPTLGTFPFEPAEGESVETGAKLFESLVKQER
jgi:dethiobiotin synthetase